MFFAICNSILLGIIAIIHIYWLFGGKWGINKALPSSKDGTMVLKPRALETLVVAVGLCCIVMLHLDKINVISLSLPEWLNQYALKVVSLIFLIRAIGEFRYIGFFKKIKDTPFARSDTKFYSPLCLLLSLNSLLTSLQI